MIRTALAITLAAALLAACSSSHATPAAPTSTASYVHDVQAHTHMTDNPATLLRLGHTICRYFRTGGSFAGILAGITEPQGALRTSDANTVILDAVEYLCPSQKDALSR